MFRKLEKYFLGSLLVVLLSACAPGSGGKPTPTPLPPLVTYEKSIFPVELGTIVSERKIVGDIVPSKQDDLFFRTGGYVTRVTVKAGDEVKKGDILAELDVNDMLNQLQQARIDLEVTQSDLAKNKAQHAFDIEKAKANVIILQKQVELQKMDVSDSLGLSRQKAQLNLDILEQNLALAQQALVLSSEDVNTYLEQALKRSELSVQRLEGLLSERQITAPYDGMIMKSSIRAGQQVDAYFSAFTLGDPSQMVVRSAYDFDLAGRLTRDSEVTFFASSDDKTGYKTQYLVNFKPQRGVENTNQQSSLTDYLYFSLPTDLPKDQAGMGHSVFLNIILGRKDNALLLPPAAIREYKGLKFVIVQENDKRRRIEVNEIGLKSTDRWEVIADLKVGDQVLGP